MPTTFPSLIDRLVTRACARQLGAIPTRKHTRRETTPRPVFRYR